MAEEYQNSYGGKKVNDDFAKIQEWLYLCVAKWYWFLIALVITFSLAAFYILVTPPIFTRQTSILIRQDDNNGPASLSSEFGKFSDFGISSGNTNLYNEIISLQSPSNMLEVVKGLHLDMNYKIKGTFHEIVLYGKSLPIEVSMPDLNQDETAAVTVNLNESGVVELSDFKRNGVENTDKIIKARLGSVVSSPIGKIIVTPSQYYVGKYDSPIYVSRVGLSDITNSYVSRLTVDLNNDKASVIDLTIDDVSPKRAEDILNMLFVVYNEQWVADINKAAISTSKFIDEELSTIESELGNVDEDISSFKSKHLVPDIATASNLYMNKSEATSAKLLDLNNQLNMAKYIRHQLSNEGNRYKLLPANSGIDNASVAQQIIEYNEKLQQRNSLVANSSTSNPLVVDLDRALSATRNAIITSLDNVLVTLKVEIGSLKGSEQETTSQIAQSPAQAKYLLSVERQQKVKEQLYLFLLQKREENQLSKAFTAYNTRMINPPAGSKNPTKPVKINLFLIAFVLGLFIPMIILFIVNNMDTAVHTRKDLDSLTMPFIGEIPLSYRKRKGIFAFFNKKEIRQIVVQEKSRNEINEAFRVVRTNLEFISGKDEKSKVIMLTSANSGSGKTFITMNLATSFAIKGKKVLVIDLDMRKASLSTFVNTPDTGISDYLSERIDDFENIIVKGKTNPNLDAIPVGTIPPNPTELLFSERLVNAINVLKTRYDFIFIDCPPLEIVADASIINKFCDMTVFVVRAGLFDRSMMPDVEKYYTEHRYKNMTLILNGTTTESNGYGYHKYGYSYGYSYGYGESGK
jgi:tyrosine-protein kinase Etk/Wzc